MADDKNIKDQQDNGQDQTTGEMGEKGGQVTDESDFNAGLEDSEEYED